MSVSSTCQKSKYSFDQSGHQTKTSEEFLLMSEDLLDQSVYTQKNKDLRRQSDLQNSSQCEGVLFKCDHQNTEALDQSDHKTRKTEYLLYQ